MYHMFMGLALGKLSQEDGVQDQPGLQINIVSQQTDRQTKVSQASIETYAFYPSIPEERQANIREF